MEQILAFSKKNILLVTCSMLCVALIFFTNYYFRRDKLTVSVGETKIRVELANTPEALYRGLSGRKNLCPDCGMLFIFPKSSRRTFVMRDMKIKLDIIWINNGKIDKIDENLPPEGRDPAVNYESSGEVSHVLEVNAGFSKSYNLKVNDEIKINY